MAFQPWTAGNKVLSSSGSLDQEWCCYKSIGVMLGFELYWGYIGKKAIIAAILE